MALPPAIQPFGIAAGEFLTGIDQMIARDEQLAGSLDGVIAGSGAVTASIDGQAAAYARAVEAAGMYVDASGRVREANGRFASSSSIAAAGLDEEAAAARRAAVATGEAGNAAVTAGGKSKAGAAEAAGFGSAMKTAFLGVAIAGGYGIEQAAKFQASMAQLHTQAGVSQSAVKGLSQQVLQLAGQVGEGPSSLSEALYHIASNMASTGASGTQMMSALKVAAQGAQVGGANLVDVTNALGAAIASGIPGVQNYTQAMGYMNATVGAGDMHMQDLADAFGTGVLANIKLYGVTLRDVSAALATLGDNNIRGAVAGTDLRVAVQAMVKPAVTAKAALKDLGLSSTSFATAMKSGGLDSALKLLVTHMHAAGVSAKDEGQVITNLFGKKAGSGIGVLVGEFDRFQGKFADVKKGADAFAGDWAARSQTMAQQWNNLKSGAQALAISFGTLLLPAATKVVGAIGRFAAMLEQHPALAAFAGAILAVALAFKVVAAAEVVFNAVTDANPVMLVVIAVIALAAGLYELYTHSKLVRDIVADIGHFFAGVWRSAMQLAGVAIRWFKDGPLKEIEAAIAYFRAWWTANGEEVKRVWAGVWGVIKVIAITYWKILFTEIKLGIALLLDLWRIYWGLIKDSFLLIWNVIKAEVTMAVHIVMDVIAIFLDIVTGHWSKAWRDIQKLFHDAVSGIIGIAKAWGGGLVRLFGDLGKNVVHGLINGIKSMFGAVGSVVSSLGSGIVGGFKSILGIASPSRVFYALGGEITRGLASGVNATRQQAISESRKLAGAVRDAYAAGQVTGSQEESLLQRIQTSLQSAGRVIDSHRAALAKAMARIGLEMSAGLTQALAGAQSAAQAKAAADKLISYVRQAWQAGDITAGQASSMTRWLEADNSRLQSLATRRGNIAKTIAAAQKYAATTTSNTEQAFGLMSVAGSTPFTAGDIAAGLRQDVSQITAFKNNIAKLSKMGLNKAYIDQLIQAGPVQGGQVAAELAAGSWADIKSINSAESQIASASGSLGKTAAEAMYDSGTQAGKGFLSGLLAQQKAIEQMMARIAKAAIDTMRRELRISSPSQVFMDHGRQVVAGFVLGMEDTSRVTTAAKSLAGAAYAPYGGGLGAAGASGTTVNVHVTVNGFVGDNRQLATEIWQTVQTEALRNNRRNPSNGLALAAGR